MDDYTRRTRDWLNERFSQTDDAGIYFAHQPIYGFRKGHSEHHTVTRFIITFQIMKALGHLKFRTLLDVGGAEGYKAAVARSIFGANVTSCDLSDVACTRATEIFGIESQQQDIQSLTFDDNQFEVVLCSETLEHVVDFKQALRELYRVCSKAVVITVPHEPRESIDGNTRDAKPHAHIHSFDFGSFDPILPEASRIMSKGIVSSYLRKINRLVEAEPKRKGRRRLLLRTQNLFKMFARMTLGRWALIPLLYADDLLCRLLHSYRAMLFVILKDEDTYMDRPREGCLARRIIEYRVDYYYPQTGPQSGPSMPAKQTDTAPAS
jgi:ubiquinone/menaquinone biosynthesis C-methylase UbiE